MDTGTGEDSSPNSNDLDGWRQAIADNRLRSFRLEELAAAFQDSGPRDQEVRRALAKYLSDSILRILRGLVGFNHPNNGEDIILRAHHQIFLALLRPASADGKSLRKAFMARVLFRMKDAIAAEARERRTPDETAGTEPEDCQDGEEIRIIETLHAGAEDATETAEDDEINSNKLREPLPLDGVRDIHEQLEVKRILERIPDPRKRLAFYLYMNDVPYHSKKTNVHTIAQALNVSDRTARDWVEEVRESLENDQDIQYLKNGKLGE